MGTFADYYGDMTVAPEKLPELTGRMLHLWEQGGMMQVEEVKLFGKKIGLLHPPEPDQSGRILSCYNYFENDFWECLSYDPATGKLHSNKVGWRTFCRITLASYVLLEFYADTFGMAALDGDVFSAESYIGWLNDLFDAQYTNQRAADLWRVKLLVRDTVEQDLSRLLDPDSKYVNMAGAFNCMAVDKLEICKKLGKEQREVRLQSEAPQNEPITMAEAILRLAEFLEEYRRSDANTDEEKLARLKAIAIAPMKERLEQAVKNENANNSAAICWGRICFWSCMTTPVVLLRLTAETFELDFWPLYDALAEDIQPYESVFAREEPEPCPTVLLLSTEDFLGCSGDDRAYFWRPDSGIHFSAEMEEWMAELRQKLDSHMSREGELFPAWELVRRLVDALYLLRERCGRVFAFREMFYEFLAHAEQRPVHAAVLLLEEMAAAPDPDTEASFLAARRYLAILANRELRKIVLGF